MRICHLTIPATSLTICRKVYIKFKLIIYLISASNLAAILAAMLFSCYIIAHLSRLITGPANKNTS